MTLLAITYRVPSLQSMQIEGVEVAMKKGFGIMKTWEESPSVGSAVRRFEGLLERIGIELGDEINHPRNSGEQMVTYDTVGLAEDWSPYGRAAGICDR
jgi:hypothetical protein